MSNNENKTKHLKCPNCRCWRKHKKFLNDKGRLLKTCKKCRNYMREYMRKKKCEHNKQKSLCKECGGSSICEHNRQKSRCKDCGGSSICDHNRIKRQCKDCGGSSICQHNKHKPQCKDCGGSSICEHNRQKPQCKKCNDPVRITIKHWISSSKRYDKKQNKYDIVNFIDKCFLKNLIEDITNCVYCECKLTYEGKHELNLATIERFDNNKGHVKSNCTLACYSCNSKRSNKYTHEEFKKKIQN